MGREKTSEAPQAPITDQVTPQLIANDDTPTVYDCTLGQFVEKSAARIDELTEAVKARNETIAAMNQDVLDMRAQITALESAVIDAKKPRPALSDEDLDKLARNLGMKGTKSMQRLDDGSIRLLVTVSVDAASQLLSWAEGASEDPEEYIQNQVNEALLAYTAS